MILHDFPEHVHIFTHVCESDHQKDLSVSQGTYSYLISRSPFSDFLASLSFVPLLSLPHIDEMLNNCCWLSLKNYLGMFIFFSYFFFKSNGLWIHSNKDNSYKWDFSIELPDRSNSDNSLEIRNFWGAVNLVCVHYVQWLLDYWFQ